MCLDQACLYQDQGCVSGSGLSISGSGLSVSGSGLSISGSGLSVSGSGQDVVTSAEGDFLHFKLCGVRSASTGTAVHVAVRPDPLVGDCHTINTIKAFRRCTCVTDPVAVRLDGNCQDSVAVHPVKTKQKRRS